MRWASERGRGPAIVVRDLDVAYGPLMVQRHLDFEVGRGDVFVLMGRSGCGKSTVLRAMIGLLRPSRGDVLIDGVGLWEADDTERAQAARHFGVLYQRGALWSSMTLAENIALPLETFTDLTAAEIREVCVLKLALVGLAGREDAYPSDISGGMQKRAALARAIALDPDILFLDEPSAGLDPISSRLLDDLILALRDGLGCTVVVVSHEVASILTIADDALFLDGETRTAIARGNPRTLAESADPTVRAFLTRGALPTAVR
jgi:phospholipid/cholesterol/gamma-HCH transport system ATP-binding protein